MKITWGLRMLCAQKGIWTGAELGRRLHAEFGVRVSATTLSNLLRKTPKNVSLNVLLALCAILECTPNDILVVDTARSRHGAKLLGEAIDRVNRARAPKEKRGGRRTRRKPAPPPTRI